jgi:hypothetical protein
MISRFMLWRLARGHLGFIVDLKLKADMNYMIMCCYYEIDRVLVSPIP